MSSIRTRKIRREIIQVTCTGLGAFIAQKSNPKNTVFGAIFGGSIGAIFSEYLIPSEEDNKAQAENTKQL
mgnify:CR=1 FL=1